MKKLVLRKSMKDISKGGFSRMGIEEVDMRMYEREIREEMFEGCTNMSLIRWPQGEHSVGRYCFKGCLSVKSIEVGELMSDIMEGGFGEMRGLEVIDMKCANLKSLPKDLFINDIKLKTIIFPNSLNSKSNNMVFGFHCFYNCPIENVIYLGINSFSKVESPFYGELIKAVNVSSEYCVLYSDFCGYHVQIHPGYEDENGDIESTDSLDINDSEENTSSYVDDCCDSDTYTESDLDLEKESLYIPSESLCSLNETVTDNILSETESSYKGIEEDRDNPGSNNLGTIIGGSVSGSVLFIGVFVIVFYINKKEKMYDEQNIKQFHDDFIESNGSLEGSDVIEEI